MRQGETYVDVRQIGLRNFVFVRAARKVHVGGEKNVISFPRGGAALFLVTFCTVLPFEMGSECCTACDIGARLLAKKASFMEGEESGRHKGAEEYVQGMPECETAGLVTESKLQISPRTTRPPRYQ